MTQHTVSHGQPTDAAIERVAAKLRAFHDGLPADEQAALHVALGHEPADGAEEDVAGHVYQRPIESSGIDRIFGRPIDPLRDWCGTCRVPWDPAQLPR